MCGTVVASSEAVSQTTERTARTRAPKRAQAVRVPKGSIVIDGRLDEAEWNNVSPAEDFVQQQPHEGAPATEGHMSNVRFLYDDDNLYVGAAFHEDEPEKLVTDELRRDFNARDGDVWSLTLDTFHDELNAFNFATNPKCALRDLQTYDDARSNNANWDAVWFCRSSVQGTVWYVELAVPFKQLRFSREQTQVWGLNLFRLVRHTNEQTVWNPVPRQFGQFKTSFAGVLEGLQDVRPGRNIRVKPFATSQARLTGGRTHTDGDGGLDIKVGLGTNLVLDGTFRTDFSQVEADAQQVNLTRFSLFFPEKREFFLENQGAFQIGPPAVNSSNLVPFFSRTIGLGEDRTPIPIVGGARLSGKVGRNSLAVLNIQTEDETRTGLSDLPGSNFSAFRFGREFLRNSSASVFYLGKEQGDISNRLVGSDLRYYPTREVNIDGMFLHSEKTGFGGGDAWRAGAQYNPGLSQLTFSFTSLGDSFKDDLGFVPREGVAITSVNGLRRLRPRALAGYIREIRPEIPYNRYTRDAINPSTGRAIGVETETIGPLVTVEFSDASTASYEFLNDEELLTTPFRPQGIPPGRSIPAGRYSFNTGTLSYAGSNSRRLALNGAYRTGGYYNGDRVGFTLGGRFRFNERLATALSVSRDSIDLPDGASFTTDLMSLRFDTSFSTRMFLNAFVQYNSVTKQLSSNIRYDFIHHPLSDLYVVYNDAHFVDVARPTPAQQPSRALVVKLTHLLSF